jgi:hypothetical protein
VFLLSYFVHSQKKLNHLIDDGHFGYNAKLKKEHYLVGISRDKMFLSKFIGPAQQDTHDF